MPIRTTSWQRRGAHATEPVVLHPPAHAKEPGGLRRLLYAEPAGSVGVLLALLVALILAVHGGASLLRVNVAWLWAAVAVVAAAALAADWPDATAGPVTTPAARRAALSARIVVFALLGAAFSLVAVAMP